MEYTSFFNVDMLVVVDKVLAVIVIALWLIFMIFHIKRLTTKILVIISFALLLIALLIDGMTCVTGALGLVCISISSAIIFINSVEFKRFFSNNYSKIKKTASPTTNNSNFYQEIEDAVLKLSRSKTGAIMTFEKKDRILDQENISSQGTTLSVPLSSIILRTIFYKGTPLHDGALVIKEDTIIAAGVTFKLSEQGLDGNYGTRHRAAVGISEKTDSVTVVVSEETGKISIMYRGQIFACLPNVFLRQFQEYMNRE